MFKSVKMFREPKLGIINENVVLGIEEFDLDDYTTDPQTLEEIWITIDNLPHVFSRGTLVNVYAEIELETYEPYISGKIYLVSRTNDFYLQIVDTKLVSFLKI